jgi:hypothetical protein
MNAPGIRLLSVGSLLFATSFAPARSVENVGGCTPGTYLAVEGSGTRSIWTFSSDGTFQATSSAERLFTFSHIQGAWQREGGRGARAVGLDFGFASQQAGAGVPPQWTTRIDAALEFSRDCQQVTGTFDLRFYDVPDDPLAALTTAPNGSDTLIGRRLQVP